MKYHLSDYLVIGHIARFTAQKNSLFLIDIFHEIYKLKPKAKLLLISDGDLKEAMMTKIHQLHMEDSVFTWGVGKISFSFIMPWIVSCCQVFMRAYL